MLAKKRLAQNWACDDDLLVAEFVALMSEDLDFCNGSTVFSIPEIDSLIEAEAPEEEGDPADEMVSNAATARVRPGDIWKLGPPD